jgi:hypothetical protein
MPIVLTRSQPAIGDCAALRRAGEHHENNLSGLLVRPEVALKQREAEVAAAPGSGGFAEPSVRPLGGLSEPGPTGGTPAPSTKARPKRFHGSVNLDPARVGRDADRIADEVIALRRLLSSDLAKRRSRRERRKTSCEPSRKTVER